MQVDGRWSTDCVATAASVGGAAAVLAPTATAEEMSVAQMTGQSSCEVLKASGGVQAPGAGTGTGAEERYVL